MRAMLSPLLVLCVCSSASVRCQGHPHFDDGGTLHWYTTFAEAKAAAKAADRLIFIEFGRKA